MSYNARDQYDAIVIGGGFYGCSIALHLRQTCDRVLVVESAADLLTRASYRNQARVHQGYHYPRSLLTGLRSAENFRRFSEDFAPAIFPHFTKLYAIAREHSKISANQFVRFCAKIRAPLEAAPQHLKQLFSADHIEDLFLVREFAFDAEKLRELLRRRLLRAGVEILTGTAVARVSTGPLGLTIHTQSQGTLQTVEAYLCTYSSVNRVLRASHLPQLPLKLELAEVALIEPPEPLGELGVTVMDGPFFSTMPFPAANLHSLTHVRYTPHGQVSDDDPLPWPGGTLGAGRRSNYPLMVRDAVRYLPALRHARYQRSLFEAKTTLPQNEQDDGRPILYRQDFGLAGLCVVIGAKLDNIYDVLAAIDERGGRRLEPQTIAA